MFRTIFLGGFLGALLFIVYFYTIFLIFKNPFLADPKSVDFFIYVVSIAGGIYYFRNYANQKYMAYWEGFCVGFAQTVLMATLCSLFIYVFLQIEKEPLQLYIADMLKTFTENKAGIIKNMGEKFYNDTYITLQKTPPEQMAWFEFRTKLLLGFFVTFITSLVLRRKKMVMQASGKIVEAEKSNKGKGIRGKE